MLVEASALAVTRASARCARAVARSISTPVAQTVDVFGMGDLQAVGDPCVERIDHRLVQSALGGPEACSMSDLVVPDWPLGRPPLPHDREPVETRQLGHASRCAGRLRHASRSLLGAKDLVSVEPKEHISVEPRERIELSTFSLRVKCSTD